MVRRGAPASIEEHPKDHMTVTQRVISTVVSVEPYAQPNPRGPRQHAANGDRSYDDDDGELTFTEANPPDHMTDECSRTRGDLS